MSSIRKHNKKLNRNFHNGLLSKAYKYGKLRGVKVALYVEYSEKQELVSFKSHKDFDLEQLVEKKLQLKTRNYSPEDVEKKLNVAQRKPAVAKTSDPSVPAQAAVRIELDAPRRLGLRKFPELPEFNMTADYFRLLPVRLEYSVALRDAVALFFICWGNNCRAYSPKILANLEVYGKALRSLQRALSGEDNEGKQLPCETLAAVSVMDRIEVLFGEQPRLQSTTHSQGIYSLMAKRGPPDLDDDLDTNYILSQGGDDFYMFEDWKNTLIRASHQKTEASRALIEHYFFSLEIQGWPRLIKWFKHITEDENEIKRTNEAIVLWDCLDTYKSGLNRLRERMIAELNSGEQIAGSPDYSTGSKTACRDKGLIQRLLMCTSLSLVINRMMRPIATDIGAEVLSDIDSEHRQLSESIRSYLMETSDISPVLSALLASPLALPIEAVGKDAEHAVTLIKILMRQNAAGSRREEEERAKLETEE
ncbi:hypothetical protein HJFPF1_10740 [Paramyrothecium foliicola]|nr:hypothetical protein HJFPF1_10740 [Paramyrothecium foliicola]